MYTIQKEFYVRIHHVRPRFKNDVESVLLFMATEIARSGKLTHEEFKNSINDAIRLYPGNASKTQKQLIIGALRYRHFLV